MAATFKTVFALVPALILGAGGVRPAGAEVAVRVDPSLGLSDAQQSALVLSLEQRVTEAARFLREATDYAIDPADETIRILVGIELDRDGTLLPASYTFSDSTIRLAPAYAAPAEDAEAHRILREILRLGDPPEAILSRCTPWERSVIPQLVDAFTFSELVHELYHDWQNRSARFPEIEAAKRVLRSLSANERLRVVESLDRRGIDLARHERQISHAEEEATLIQRFCWEGRIGEHAEHPLASAIRRLFEDAALHYHLLRTRPEEGDRLLASR